MIHEQFQKILNEALPESEYNCIMGYGAFKNFWEGFSPEMQMWLKENWFKDIDTNPETKELYESMKEIIGDL